MRYPILVRSSPFSLVPTFSLTLFCAWEQYVHVYLQLLSLESAAYASGVPPSSNICIVVCTILCLMGAADLSVFTCTYMYNWFWYSHAY